MRIIDADAMMRVYQEVLCNHVSCIECSFFMDDKYCRFETMLSEAPTVDAVPVVRCKDCVNGTVFVNKQGAEYVDCVLDDYSVRKPIDYCSYGKRKEGAD